MSDHHVRIDAPAKKDSLSIPGGKPTKEDVLKTATHVVEEGSDSTDDEKPSGDEPAKVTKDRKTRGKYEFALLKKTKELSAVQERLYYVRWDKTRSGTEQKAELANLAREYARIKLTIEILLQKSTTDFEETLQLGGLHLPKSLGDHAYKPLVNVASEANIDTIKVEPGGLALDELESEKFMRTKSTQTLKDKQTKPKWEGVASLLKELKPGHKDAVQDAQQVLNRKASAGANHELVIMHKSEDLVSLRKAIMELKGRKSLTKKDQELLKKMQEKLADMTGVSRDAAP